MTAKKASEILYALTWEIRTGRMILPENYVMHEVTEALTRGKAKLYEDWKNLPEEVKLALLEANNELEITDKAKFEAQKIIDKENEELNKINFPPLTDC